MKLKSLTLENVEYINKRTTKLFDILKYNTKKYSIPETFFKYYALSPYSVDAITKQYVYASHPTQMNDPFDCAKSIIDFDDEEVARCLLKDQYDEAKQSFPPKEFQKFCQSVFNTRLFRKIGIFSMTDSSENDLMWAHYANQLGFCVEFDIKQFPFLKYDPFPINYIETVKPIRTSEMDIFPIASILCSVKHTMWSYENEWRLMIECPEGKEMKSFGYWQGYDINLGCEHDRKFYYPISAIKKIILRHTFLENEKIESIGGNERVWKLEIIKNNEPNKVDRLKKKLLNFITKSKIPTSIQLLSSSFGKYDIVDVQIKRKKGYYEVVEF